MTSILQPDGSIKRIKDHDDVTPSLSLKIIAALIILGLIVGVAYA